MVDYSFNLILTELLIFIDNLWIWRLEKVGDKMLKLSNLLLQIQSSFPLWRKEI